MKRAWALLAAVLLLSGCGSRQLEEEMLVIVLAADKTAEGGIRLTVKAPSTSEEKGASGQDDQKGYLLLEAAGRDFSQASALLDASTPRKLNFSQVREVVIGEKAANDARLSELLRRIDDLPRMRGAAAVIVCAGEAADFAAAQKPYMGLRLSRYAETTLAHYAGKGFTPETSLEEALRDLGGGFRDPLFIYGAVNDFSRDQPKEDNVLDQAAGSLPRKSADPIDLFGAAATDGTAVCGTLSGYETALLYLLKGGGHSLNMQLEENVPLTVTARTAARLTVDLSASPARLGIALLCDVGCPPGEAPDEAALVRRLSEELKNVIRRMQAMGCDGAGFGTVAVRRFLTVPAWEQLNWRQIYQNAQVEISVDLRLQGQ